MGKVFETAMSSIVAGSRAARVAAAWRRSRMAVRRARRGIMGVRGELFRVR